MSQSPDRPPWAVAPPPAHAAPSSRRLPPWLIPVAAVAVVGMLAFTSIAGWFVYSHYVRKDPGIRMCEVFRDSAAKESDGSTNVATRADYEELRDNFEKSRHDDIRVAGIHVADTFWQFFQSGENPTAQEAYRRQLLSALTDLQGACADHGVTITINWN